MSRDEAVGKAVISLKAGGFQVEPFAFQRTGTEYSIYPPDVDIIPANICGNIGLDAGDNVKIILSCVAK